MFMMKTDDEGKETDWTTMGNALLNGTNSACRFAP